MKVVFIGQKGIPAIFGGIEYHVDELSKALVARGHEVTVYVRPWYSREKKKFHEGVRLVRIPTIPSKHLDASLHSFLCSLHCLFIKSDIIHYHAIGPTFFSIIPSLFRKKTVTTVHRLDWSTEKWGKLAKWLLKIGERISARVPKRTIVVSEELQKYFLQKYNLETAHFSHGITIPPYLPVNLIKDKYGLQGKDYILFMGRLAPEKRVDWLIRSFLEVIQNSLRTLKLVIAGGSNATDDYFLRLKKMSAENTDIFFPGYVTGKEKAELLGNALFFVLPSHLEGFPIALLEAKSYGVCCLASDIPAHREAIQSGKNGLLFNAEDSEDLTSKLTFLIENPDQTAAMGNLSLQEIKKSPSWWDIAGHIEAVYKKALQD